MGKSAAELAKQFTENNNSGRTKSLRIASKVPTPETTPTKGGRHKTAPKEKTEIEEASQVPDYTNRILSYNDPETGRAGHGVVKNYNHEQEKYEVLFKFFDNADPFQQTDWCPLNWVERTLIDEAAGRAWTAALEKEVARDSPSASNKRKAKEKSSPLNAKTRKKKSQKIDDSEDSDKDEDEGGSTPTNKKAKQHKMSGGAASTEKNVLDSGIIAMLMHSVREAIYDIRPNTKCIKPFMYWNPNKPTSAAKMLIKRTTALRLIADKYRKNEFARLYAKVIRTTGNNERSAQIRQMKTIYLHGDSDFCLVSDYKFAGTTITGNPREMRVASTLASELETIDHLRDALLSYNMYNFPKLFDLFCAGLESGRFRATAKMDMSPIEDLISVAHEAHFRLELWFSLENQAFRHDASKIANGDRRLKHNELCRLVAQDRRENGANAFKHRCTKMGKSVNDDDSSSDDEDGVDSQFY
jgi:hypothetical protein